MTQTTWSAEVIEDPDNPGEFLLDLGLELCSAMGWQVGDELEWSDNKDGTWMIKKKS
jgi:hypothetical protein